MLTERGWTKEFFSKPYQTACWGLALPALPGFLLRGGSLPLLVNGVRLWSWCDTLGCTLGSQGCHSPVPQPGCLKMIGIILVHFRGYKSKVKALAGLSSPGGLHCSRLCLSCYVAFCVSSLLRTAWSFWIKDPPYPRITSFSLNLSAKKLFPNKFPFLGAQG